MFLNIFFKFTKGSALENVCKQCNKRVYEMEKITVDFVIYHKSCFRCATCKRMLRWNVSSIHICRFI